MAIRGVILDVDGTLVLSNDAHAQAWVEALAVFGYHVPYERVRSLIGMGGDQLLPTLLPGMRSTDGLGKEIAQTRQRIFLERYARTLKPAPGAQALVQHMKERGLKLAIGSSASRDELSVVLKVAGIAGLVDVVTSSSDAPASKPAPDVIVTALHSLDMAPDEVLMIGDTKYDVAAAHRAGIGVIAVRCGGSSDEELNGALAIYDSPADILAHYDKSPLGKQTLPA